MSLGLFNTTFLAIACIGALNLLLAACAVEPRKEQLTIGAASSLQPLLHQVVPLFEEATESNISVSYGASGAIARQIEQGSPIDLFASADFNQVQILQERQFLLENSIHTFGIGHVIIVRSNHAHTIKNIEDASLIAIPNPSVAPYGAAAKRQMRTSGLWDAARDNVVLAANALQAFHFAQRGEVDLALVPLSLFLANPKGVERLEDPRFKRTPDSSLAQTFAVVADSKSPRLATRFINYFGNPSVLSLLETSGYSPTTSREFKLPSGK